MAIVLFDNRFRRGLLPFTYTKAVAGLRSGIFTVQERWEKITGQHISVNTVEYLQPLYPRFEAGDDLWIDAAIIPDKNLIDTILSLDTGSAIADEKGLIAGRIRMLPADFNPENSLSGFGNIRDYSPVKRILHPWQFMQWNDAMIRFDMELQTSGRSPAPIPGSVNTIQPEQIFIEEGASLSFCTLNAGTGPIYIGKHAEIMEGSVIRGPFVLGDNAVVKINSRIYGATSIGPSCMAGGEIKNTVMMGYSNKAHDGYLGDSVIGEWCNFGAGSTCSNVKNTASIVKIWDMDTETYLPVGNKCGMVMGDYSRVAINSSINTGTMIGVSCNVFGKGLLPTIIPNFSWGVDGVGYEFPKAIEAIDHWKQFKQQSITREETSVLKYIFEKL
jgi:UDP-N-acetylglucosamine diphosphorylase/glucosamine-1-phosphate N-acetyltransferase